MFIFSDKELDDDLAIFKISDKDEKVEITDEEKMKHFENILRKRQGKVGFHTYLEKGFNNYAPYSPPNYCL